MNKEEIIQKIVAVKGLTSEEVTQKYTEFYDEFRDMNIPTEYLEHKTQSRLVSFYLSRTSGTVYEGMLLGKSNITDYGAQTFYDQIKLQFDRGTPEIKQAMVTQGEVSQEGEPLWHNCDWKSIPAWRYTDKKTQEILPIDERKIKLSEEIRANGVCICREEGTEGYVPSFITFYGKAALATQPFFSECKFVATGLKETEDGIKLLNVSKPEFTLLDSTNVKISYEDLINLVGKSFPSYIVEDESDVENWFFMNPKARVVFIKNATVLNTEPYIGEGNVGAMRLGNIDMMLQSDNGYGGLSVLTPAGFAEYEDGTTDVCIIAQPSLYNNKLSLMYLNSLPKFVVERTPIKPVDQTTFKEVTENESTQPMQNNEPKPAFDGIKGAETVLELH